MSHGATLVLNAYFTGLCGYRTGKIDIIMQLVCYVT